MSLYYTLIHIPTAKYIYIDSIMFSRDLQQQILNNPENYGFEIDSEDYNQIRCYFNKNCSNIKIIKEELEIGPDVDMDDRTVR